MPTEQQVKGLVTICVSRMAAYLDAEGTPDVRAEVVAEIQDLAKFAGQWGLRADEENECIVRPVEARLIERYGWELGFRLYRVFSHAYDEGDRQNRLVAGAGPLAPIDCDPQEPG